MPSGFLWAAYQILRSEMEYCVRIETRLYLPKYKKPLKIIRSDMRKVENLFAHSCYQYDLGHKMKSVTVNTVAGGKSLSLDQEKGRYQCMEGLELMVCPRNNRLPE